jgi:hypothetical protein
VTVPIDPNELGVRWNDQWRPCRPIAHEFRHCLGDRWVRFHSLPESKRYAESDAERDQILRRHNTLLDELLSATNVTDDSLLVATCAWSGSASPVRRDEPVQATTPSAVYWQSILREVDDGDEFWNHLYVNVVRWRRGVLDDLLLLVADGVTADAFVAPMNLEWLYHPYDGGADVIEPSIVRRKALSDAHRAWLSKRTDGL